MCHLAVTPPSNMRYFLGWRGGRADECGGLEDRYVGNSGVGGSNPPLSASHGVASENFALEQPLGKNVPSGT
jgi:hypothetical protein